MRDLQETLSQVRAKLGHSGYRGVKEEDTKATLINPVLRALGWDLEDLHEVRHEFKLKPGDKPVDYALLVQHKPRVFIEAKALAENLADHKWANQIMGYATVAGVQWVVLTNGDEYRIYNAHAPVPVDDKIFRIICIADEGKCVGETLELLSKEQLQTKKLEALWNAHCVDRQIRPVIEKLFDPDPDPSLVNLLRGRLGSSCNP